MFGQNLGQGVGLEIFQEQKVGGAFDTLLKFYTKLGHRYPMSLHTQNPIVCSGAVTKVQDKN